MAYKVIFTENAMEDMDSIVESLLFHLRNKQAANHFIDSGNSKAIYSKIPLKSLSACSDTSTSYIISHNPCECQQRLSSHFLSVQPAYPHILSPILH